MPEKRTATTRKPKRGLSARRFPDGSVVVQGCLPDGKCITLEIHGSRLDVKFFGAPLISRIDTGSDNFNEQMERIFREIVTEGKRVKTKLADTLLEDRE